MLAPMSWRVRSRLVVLAGVLLILMTALSSWAVARAHLPSKIVLNQSIGGLKLGLTARQVERRLGKPAETLHEGGRVYQLTYYDYNLVMDFDTTQSRDPSELITAIGLPYVEGSTIDFVDGLQGAGFKVDNPNVIAACGCGSSFRVAEEEEVSAV